jgi:hypothetical protein
MPEPATIHSAIRLELIKRGPCTLKSLIDGLPQFSWNEMFAAIDQLSRAGNLVLRHQARFDYEVSAGPEGPIVRQPAERSDDDI